MNLSQNKMLMAKKELMQDAELFSFVFQNFCEHSGLESKSLSKNLGKSIQLEYIMDCLRNEPQL